MAGSLNNSNLTQNTPTRRSAPRSSSSAPVLFRLPTVQVDGVRVPQATYTQDASASTSTVPNNGYAIPAFLATSSEVVQPMPSAVAINTSHLPQQNSTTVANTSASASTTSVSPSNVTAEHETGNWKSRLLNRLILVLLVCLIGVGLYAQRRANMAEAARRESNKMEAEMAGNVELPPPPAIPDAFASNTSSTNPTSGTNSDKTAEALINLPDMPASSGSNSNGSLALESNSEPNLNASLSSPSTLDMDDSEPNISFGTPSVSSNNDQNSSDKPNTWTITPASRSGTDPSRLDLGKNNNGSNEYQDFPGNSSNELETPTLIAENTQPQTPAYTETNFREQSPDVLLAARKARLDSLNGNLSGNRNNSDNTYLTSQSQPVNNSGSPVGNQPTIATPYTPIGAGLMLQGNAYPEIPNNVQGTSIPNGGPVGPAITANRNPNLGANPNTNPGYVPVGNNYQPIMNNPNPNNLNVAPPRSGYGGVAPGGTPANYSTGNPTATNSGFAPNGQPIAPNMQPQPTQARPYQNMLNQIQNQYLPENQPPRNNFATSQQQPNPYGPYNSTNVANPPMNSAPMNSTPSGFQPSGNWSAPQGVRN